ncbi:MAG: archease [Flavobacteriaceae bacterium]
MTIKDFDNKLERKRARRRKYVVETPPNLETSITLEGIALQDIFKGSLRALGHLLSPGTCSSLTHYDCIMKIEVSAPDYELLLVQFLTKVLALGYTHKAIFCTTYFEEFSEKRLVAQLYGTWFMSYDKEIKSVIRQKCSIARDEDFSCRGTITFKY